MAAYWRDKESRFGGQNGETTALSEGEAVCIKTGKIKKAKNGDATLRPPRGIVGKGGAADENVEVVTRGRLGGLTAAAPGSKLYLGTTAGTITTTCPDSTSYCEMGVYVTDLAGNTTTTEALIDCLSFEEAANDSED